MKYAHNFFLKTLNRWFVGNSDSHTRNLLEALRGLVLATSYSITWNAPEVKSQ
jgi:hypothetical protein